MEKISARIIGAFGSFIIWQALHSATPDGRKVITIKPVVERNHVHGDQCKCGHNHGVDYTGKDSNGMTHFGVILLIGARPCNGAIMILLFSNFLLSY